MPDPVKIASFNMYKFSYRRDKEIRKNLSKIADIICGEGFSIVAMQEALNEGAVQQLMLCLGPTWEYKWDHPISGHSAPQAAEGYAYLWKKSEFRLATGRKSEEDTTSGARKTYDPRIFHQYPRDPILTYGRLARDPFYIRLESLFGWYEIRLINTHIMFSNRAGAEDEAGVSASNVQKRRQELAALIHIYSRLSVEQYRSRRPSYTFLLGDYNLNLKREWIKPPYLTDEVVEEFENGRLLKKIVTVQDKLTTLKSRSVNEPGKPAQGFANNYDHFTFDELRFTGMQHPICDRIDSVQKYCDGDFELHRKEISDHVPICLSFSLNER